MGVRLGGFVDGARRRRSAAPRYLAFVAPGLLAAHRDADRHRRVDLPGDGRVQVAASLLLDGRDAAGARDIVSGQLGFVAFRVLTSCGVFLLVMAPFGAFALAGWARSRALPVRCWSGWPSRRRSSRSPRRMRSETRFALIFRLGIMPMFLFSGAFFPISQLPTWIELAGLPHPALARRRPDPVLSLGNVDWPPALGTSPTCSLWRSSAGGSRCAGFDRQAGG